MIYMIVNNIHIIIMKRKVHIKEEEKKRERNVNKC